MGRANIGGIGDVRSIGVTIPRFSKEKYEHTSQLNLNFRSGNFSIGISQESLNKLILILNNHSLFI